MTTHNDEGTLEGSASVLIINQHGDNRGDEAAMRAMIRRFSHELPGASFTILHQFSDPASCVDLGNVKYLPLRLSLPSALRLAVFVLLARLGVKLFGLLDWHGREIVEEYGDADLVVCAPGGPYFGDLYADHEVVHWFYVWMAAVLRRPVVLYAPSVGPFGNRLLNPIRRRGFRCFESITLREKVSHEYLRGLLGDGVKAIVTADSALQEQVAPTHVGIETRSGERTVVVSVREPSEPLRARHDEAVLEALESVCRSEATHVVFLPQLHGLRRDRPYLERLAGRLRHAARVTVADEALDSDSHRALVASADLVIAGRYHPAVFAISAGVPVLVIPYEHKAWGVARAAGIEPWTVDVEDVAPGRLVPLLEDLIAQSDRIRLILARASEELSAKARISTESSLAAFSGYPK